nr:hypothetical protein Iba_chr12aCG17100 [Ipomoea batatas]GMD71053.1 hypothetical protein Iba_chr12eCG12260 [Ipomoea batatas]
MTNLTDRPPPRRPVIHEQKCIIPETSRPPDEVYPDIHVTFETRKMDFPMLNSGHIDPSHLFTLDQRLAAPLKLATLHSPDGGHAESVANIPVTFFPWTRDFAAPLKPATLQPPDGGHAGSVANVPDSSILGAFFVRKEIKHFDKLNYIEILAWITHIHFLVRETPIMSHSPFPFELDTARPL